MVPYQLNGGTVLDFYRNCEILSSDIDVSIPLEWWQAGDNRAKLRKAMAHHGFELWCVIK